MTKGEMEILDIEKVLLQCSEDQDVYLQRLSTRLSESRSRIITSIHEFNVKRREHMIKNELNSEIINQLNVKSKDIESKSEEIRLQQKVMRKKIENSIQIENKMRAEIEVEKIKKENLTLEMVDLQQKKDEHKKLKKQEWNAIKKASAAYKEYLNMHIGFTAMDDHDSITVTFFTNENPTKDNYYIMLSNFRNTKWRVDRIVPPLKDEDLNELNLHFSMDYDLSQITIFICQIRNIFVKNYFKSNNG